MSGANRGWPSRFLGGRLALGFIAMVLVMFVANAHPVQAKSVIHVRASNDELTDNGECSLREAILLTNGSSSDPACGKEKGGPYTIRLHQGSVYTLSLAGGGEDDSATGDLDLNAEVSIVSKGRNGATINGDAIDRVLHVHSGASLTLENVTVTGGHTTGETQDEGAGIRNEGMATLVMSHVRANHALGVTIGEESRGGGIYNTGSLKLLQSSLNNNSAIGAPEGTGSGSGAGLFNAGGEVTMTESEVAGNAGGFGGRGGGIYSESGKVLLLNSSIVGNLVGSGGGVQNDGAMTVQNSTISRNVAGRGSGGGIRNTGTMMISGAAINENDGFSHAGGIENFGTLDIVNSTIGDNFSQNEGGISNRGTLFAINVTVVGNLTPGDVGGINTLPGASTSIVNSIVAGNTNILGPGDPNPGATDCTGMLTSGGHNLIGRTMSPFASCTILGDAEGDVFTEEHGVDTLANNGGPTLTRALLPDSPAIDAGNDVICDRAPVNGVDQRGIARPRDGDDDGEATCDIGAFELE